MADIAEMRSLYISTFTDQFQVLQPTTSDITALKTRLHMEQNFQERPCFIREDDGVEVEDCELIGDLPEGACLICITSHCVRNLEAKMAKLQSPGDEYQKYLRWLKSVSADDPRIAQTVWVEINGLIEEIVAKESVLLEQQAATSLKIEEAMKQQERDEPPPNMPSAKDMKDPAKMQEYMLQMGEYSARQQLKLQNLGPEVAANQAVTAEVNKLQEEKRKLQNFSDKLQFSISAAQLATLTPEEAAKVMDIQKQLGVTPRGSINTQCVRSVLLYKEKQSTRLGIIFHQNTPEELNDISSDMTPRGGGAQPVVLPVIKVLDKSGIAGSVNDLNEGDQVLSVNGQAALSNIQAVQMLREAVGEVVLAVRDTPLTRTPRGTPINPNLSSGLRPINVQ